MKKLTKTIRSFFNRYERVNKKYNIKNENLFKYDLPVYTR